MPIGRPERGRIRRAIRTLQADGISPTGAGSLHEFPDGASSGSADADLDGKAVSSYASTDLSSTPFLVVCDDEGELGRRLSGSSRRTV